MAPKQDFLVKVIKTEVVAAVLPMQEHWLPLSNLDLLLPPVEVGVFFCYQKPSSASTTFGSMTSVLKKALAQTLVSYYSFAGEMVQNVGGEPELLCNNRGVDFVEAFADIELLELNLYNPDDSIEGKLVPQKEKGVMSVQVTQLKCGGLVVGCTFDHRVADAYSANMFLVSWAEMARSKPLTTLPSYRRSSLFSRRPGHYDDSINNMYSIFSKLPLPEKESNGNINTNQAPISRIYYVKAEHVHQLQLLANEDNNCVEGSKRTKLEAFTAFLWKLIAKGTNAGDKYCRLGIVVDGRTRLFDGDENEAKLMMNNYFGNVLSIPFGQKKNKELEKMPLSIIANEVHNFLHEAVTKEHFLGLIDFVEAHRPEPALAKIYASKVTKEEPAFVVSSGQRFPIRKIDFGWGVPVFGSYHFPWGAQSGYVMPMPSASGNGDWVVYMHLPEEQIKVIEYNAAHVFKPFSHYCLSFV
ncbi:hypothetical protein ACH5RR_017760 [Cinchona calisaya]|uniref:Uncharacterized protein n=1 Tax=Cinchona calisaya TaxID=153742 RepID=A0ABD2ZL95_9GENT